MPEIGQSGSADIPFHPGDKSQRYMRMTFATTRENRIGTGVSKASPARMGREWEDSFMIPGLGHVIIGSCRQCRSSLRRPRSRQGEASESDTGGSLHPCGHGQDLDEPISDAVEKTQFERPQTLGRSKGRTIVAVSMRHALSRECREMGEIS